MREALYAKFSQSKKLRDKLIATGDTILHEDSPYDKYWGVRGQDRLGKFLMELREKLKGGVKWLIIMLIQEVPISR